jgi:anthranilate synthase component 2
MRLVLVDAWDSFTHNLAHALGSTGARVEVVRCDQVSALALRAADLVVLGPGPGEPDDAGCFLDAVPAVLGRVPLLGVCLGHQALAVALGGHLRRQDPVHGLAVPIHHTGSGLFRGLPQGVPMTRYNSLGVDESRLPAGLEVCARAPDGAVMGVAHRTAPAWGVQFHPESVLSGDAGVALLARFVALGSAFHRSYPAAGSVRARAMR